MPRFGSGSDLARELGITRQAVSKAEKAGRISRAANGDFDLDAARIQYRLHTDPEQQLRSLQQERSTPAGVAVLERPSYEFEGDAKALVAAKARREQAEAQIAELELAEKRGEIIANADHKRVVFALCRSICDALMPLADRITPLVAAESEPAKVHAVITAEIRQVLRMLANTREPTDDAERLG
jgi:hypothetical protein